MIIWRGWGFLAVVFAVIGALICVGIWEGLDLPGRPQPLVGIGLALGGLAGFLLGRHVNDVSVPAKADKLLAERAEQLEQLARSGQFQMAAGMPVATDYTEARHQADQLLAQDREQVRKALRNRHTLFFIPMQWAGLLITVAGVVVSATGFAGM